MSFSYEGLVATRCRPCTSFIAANTQVMARSAHVAADPIDRLKIAIANFRLTGSAYAEQGTGGTMTVAASVEYPEGVFSQITFDGSASGQVESGGLLISNYTAGALGIPEGATFWIRTFIQNPAGVIFNPWRNAALGELTRFAASGLEDLTMGGAIRSSGNYSAPPLMIIGKTRKASVCVLGDSKAHGYMDDDEDASAAGPGLRGEIAKSFPASLAFLNLSSGGWRANLWGVAGAARKRCLLYFSHFVVQLGRNDLVVSNDPPATVRASVEAINADILAANPAALITGTTPGHTATSSDGWTSQAGQTSVDNADRLTYCSYVRSGQIVGMNNGFFDIAPCLESSPDGGKWKTDAIYTSDGVHENGAGYGLIVAAGAVDLSRFTIPRSQEPPAAAEPEDHHMPNTIKVSNGTELLAALKSAGAGDVIACAPGVYANFRIRGVMTPGVTITSADPDHLAVFADLNLQSSGGITFTGLLFDGASEEETFGWMVTGCEDIAFLGIEFRDMEAGDPQEADQGLKISQSKRVRIEGCEFHHLYRAVIADNIDELQVSRCDFHDMARTSIYAVDIRGALIEENSFTDAFPVEGDHMDAITFNVANKVTTTRDIVIRSNLVRRGKGRVTQGIIFNNKHPGQFFQDINIEGNLVLGMGLNGLYVQRARRARAVGNTVLRYPGRSDNSWGLFLDCEDVTIGDNAAQTFTATEANGNVGVKVLDDGAAAKAALVPDLTQEEEEALAAAWKAKFSSGPAPKEPVEPPAKDTLREVFGAFTVAKIEPLKTKGRVIVDFKTPAEGAAALAAVQALRP